MIEDSLTTDSASPGASAAEYAASLRALLDVTRAVRSGAAIDSVLTTIARAVSDALGFETVVLNVHRAEWNDFYVAVVHGSDAVRRALLGSVYDIDTWKPLLHPKFRREGAYFIPHEAFDWSQHPGNRFVPPGEPAVEGPDGWHPADELFVPLERSDGQILGVMSFGDPVDGLRPGNEKLAVAVALAANVWLGALFKGYVSVSRHDRIAARALRVIPPNAVVSATNTLGAHLSGRRRILSFPLRSDARWIAVDETRLSYGDRSSGGRRAADALARFRRDPRWRVVYARDGVLIFRAR